MLDAYIIEQIREREKKQQEAERPQIRCPVLEDEDFIPPAKTKNPAPTEERGVYIIEIGYEE